MSRSMPPAAAGVRRIAYTSILSPVPENPAVAAPSHRATEQALRESGLYSELGNRPVEVVDLDDESFRAGMIGDATGDDHLVYGADLVTSFGRAVREGHLASCTDDVLGLTGPVPRALPEVLKDRREALLAAAAAAG